MKRKLIYIIGFLLMVSCSSSQDVISDFDKHIIDSLKKYDYYEISISEKEYAKLKDSILKSQDLIKPYFTGLDAYTLTGYVNTINPEIDELNKKYEKLAERDKLKFIENIITTNNTYFRNNNTYFVKIVKNIKIVSRREETLYNLVKLYTNNKNLKIEHIINILQKVDKLEFSVQSFITKLVGIERENEFGYDLLLYLSERSDWSKTDNYVRYWDLYETKNKDLNYKYKTFFKKQLLTEGYQENPWNGYNSFLPKWFSKSEIIDICKQKKQEKKQYHNKIRNIELYISNAGFYQAKYFPIDSTIKIIEEVSAINQKLFLSFILLNTRFDITGLQKQKIKENIYKFKDVFFDSNATNLLILTLRSLDTNISFESIIDDFPNLYKDWYPKSYLEDLYKSSKYNWLDFMNKASKYRTFKMELKIDDYHLCEYITGNYAFRLNNSFAIDAILSNNNLRTFLNDEYGDWPIDYSYIIKTGFESVFNRNISADFDCFYSYKSINQNETYYSIYFKLGKKIHKLSFIDNYGLPNNEAITLLINKALIDFGIKQRFYKYSSDSYNLAFVEPLKYDKLIDELKN